MSKSKNEKLNARQEQFCREYIIDLNASQAAIRAGYCSKRANCSGGQLLANANIQKRIAELKNERAEKTEIKAEEVLLELHRLATADPREILDADGRPLPPAQWPVGIARCVKSYDVVESGERVKITKVKFTDKGKALETLCRHLGLLKDRLEVSAQEPTLRDILRAIPRTQKAEGAD